MTLTARSSLTATGEREVGEDDAAEREHSAGALGVTARFVILLRHSSCRREGWRICPQQGHRGNA